MADASSKASLILEVVDLDSYRAAVKAATADTEALTAAQAKVAPIQRAGKKAVDESAESAKALAKAQNEVEKAYISALAPHEKTRLKLEQTLALQFDNVEMTSKQAVAVAHLSLKLEDQTRRFEMNRGSQHKLSRSLAELLDEQTKAQTAAIAAGAAMLKEGLSAQKVTVALQHLNATTSDADKKSDAYQAQVADLTAKLKALEAAERNQGATLTETVEEFKRSEEVALKYKSVIAGALAPIALFGTGVAAMTTAVIANSAAADDWNHELVALGANLDDAGTKRVNRAAAAIDAVSVAAKMAGVAFADSMAPGMEEAGTRAVALGLAAIDTWKNFAAGKDTLTLVSELVGKGLVGAFNALVSPIKNAALGLALLSDSVGITDDAAARLNATFAEWTAGLEESTITGVRELASAVGEELVAATDDYMGKAEGMVTRTEAITRATREQTAAVEEAAEAWELYRLKAVGANEEVLKSTDKTAKGTAALSDYAARNQKEDVKAVRDATIAALEEEGAVRAQQVAFGLSVATQAADATLALVQMVAGESSKAALAAFVIQKAAALASIGVATAENISKAAALFAFPSPPGIAAVAAASALGALQAGVVVASAVGQFNSAAPEQASAGGGGSGGGGSIPTLPGGGGAMTQGAASGPATYGGGGGEPRPLSIPSSDGYFPPTMGGRTIQTAPGDEAWVQRGGAFNRANQEGGVDMSRVEGLLQALLTETRGWRQDDRVRRVLGARVAGPAGVF